LRQNATIMSRPPRIEGFDYLGPYRYFLTFCTFDRRDVFSDVATGQFVASQLRRTCRAQRFAVLAYCLMPDHAHLLVEGTCDSCDLRHLMKSAKQRSGQSFAARHEHPLWQEGFYDRVLRPEDDARKVARYIIDNPVRAGLVASPLDYELLGSDVWTVRELVDSLW
jgi:REP element-mobilizing transposase RayT